MCTSRCQTHFFARTVAFFPWNAYVQLPSSYFWIYLYYHMTITGLCCERWNGSWVSNLAMLPSLENAIYSDFLDDIAHAVAYSLGDPGSFCTGRCLDFLIKAMFWLFCCPQWSPVTGNGIAGVCFPCAKKSDGTGFTVWVEINKMCEKYPFLTHLS